jgi:serine/threonine protein kinase
MMKCKNCGSENPEDVAYCKECGALFSEKTMILNSGTKMMGDPLSFSPGEKFGDRYQIIEEIGQGGMGKVFKAMDRELNIVVALKMIKPQLSTDPDIVSRFKKELLLAREILHENVIRIHDLGEINGIKYISMNYIQGNSLSEIIQSTGKLTIEKSIDIAKQVCSALDAAHSKGIIHRDLKPQNVMIDKHGKAYVLDFGIARSLHADMDAGSTQEGIVLGSPYYMSPEQIKGERVDESTDIYSLGVLMYEMVTGRPPFEAENPVALLHLHVDRKPECPSKFNPQIPPKLENIILKCLEKKKKSRYPAVTGVVHDLEKDRTVQIPPLKLEKEEKEQRAANRVFKYALRAFILLLVIYAAISILSLINDSTNNVRIEKLKSEYETYYKDHFPVQKDWLPAEWEAKDCNAWDTYMEFFLPKETDDDTVKKEYDRIADAVKCSKLDSSGTFETGLSSTMITDYIDMVTLDARNDFREGNLEPGLAKLNHLMVFAVDLFAASSRLEEHQTALSCFNKICSQLIPLLLCREMTPGSLSPYERECLSAFGELRGPLTPVTFEPDSPPVREEAVQAAMTKIESIEKLIHAALEKFEPDTMVRKQYLGLAKRYENIYDAVDMTETNYHIYGKLKFWNNWFSINRYFYKEGIEFYEGLFERLKDIRDMYDKRNVINSYFEKRIGSYEESRNGLVPNLPRAALELNVSRTFAKLVLILRTINTYGIDSTEFLNLKGTPLLINDLSGEPFEITEDETGYSIVLDKDVPLPLKKINYREHHKEVLKTLTDFDSK